MGFTEISTPAELRARRLEENIKFDRLGKDLKLRYQPAVLFRAMLFWTRRRGKKDGLAHFCFIELFGVSERWSDKGEPVHLDDDDFYEWLRLRELRNKRVWQREKAKRRRERKLNGYASVGTENAEGLRSP